MWLGGPHSWSGHLVREIYILRLPSMKPQFLRYATCSLVTVLITLALLPNYKDA